MAAPAVTVPPPPARPMSSSTRAALIMLACAAGLGILGDLLFREASGAGLNVLLWVAALAAAAGLIRGLTDRPGPAGRWLLIAAGFASCFVIRRSEDLLVFDMLAILLAATLPGLALVKDLTTARLRDYLKGAATTAAFVAGGPIVPLATDVAWNEVSQRRSARLGQVTIGLLLALPVLLVFGSLFASADPSFKAMTEWLFRWNIQTLVSHIFVAGLFCWLAAGLLRSWLWVPKFTGVTLNAELSLPGAPVLPVAMAVGTMVALFTVFVGLQARWLFGGAALVESVQGLSYAEYARSGFFQMVAAAGLAVPVLYGADVLLDGENDAAKSKIRVMGRVQLLLIGVVMASALHRMWLYMTMFGLTQDRMLCVAIIAWLAAVCGWFARTVLRGHRERFTFGAVTSGFAVLAALNAVNPDALIARVNTDRSFADGKLDALYLSRLSEDAAPVLAERLARLPADAQCTVANALLAFDTDEGWRGWNLSHARAREAARSVVRPAGCVKPQPLLDSD